MAGREDDGLNGEVRLTPGFAWLHCSRRNRLLDPKKDVLGNVRDRRRASRRSRD